MAQIKKRILEEAKKQENWSINRIYNYGPIDYLKDKLLYKDGVYSKENQVLYEKNIHRVTDKKTYFAYLFKAYDLFVDGVQIFCDMKNAFPDIATEEVKAWIEEHKSEEQWTRLFVLHP